jgi:hypothetical protein
MIVISIDITMVITTKGSNGAILRSSIRFVYVGLLVRIFDTFFIIEDDLFASSKMRCAC